MLAAVLAVAVCWSSPDRYGVQETEYVDPMERASPSGDYVLHLDPTSSSGAGAAHYRLMHRGEELWAAKLPFTLREVAVTDEGFSFGHGLTAGDGPGGELVVAILGPDGKLMLDERTKRSPSQFFHASDNPRALGMVVDAEHRQFAVRIADADLNRGIESWRRYSISEGRRLGDLEPEVAMDVKERELLHVADARALPGTDLHLIHWWRVQLSDYTRGYFPDGAAFTLMRPDGSMAWRLDLPLDYTVDGDEKADEALEDLVRSHGAVRRVESNGRFALWFVRDQQEVTFDARLRPDIENEWDVEEASRTPHATPVPKPADELPKIALKPLDVLQLESAKADARPALINVRAWTFSAPDGGFTAVRQDQGHAYTFVDLDSTGKVLREQLVRDLPAGDDETVSWTHERGDHWLAIVQGWGEGAATRVWRVDAASGGPEVLPAFEAPRVDDVQVRLSELAPMADGGFVALGTFHFKYSMSDVLMGFDRNGRLLWTVDEDMGDPSKLFSPEDVAVTSDGSVVVVETIRCQLKVYDRGGVHVRNVDLETAFGSEPRYTSGVSAGPDGTVLVLDAGERPLWHMELDGEVLRSVAPSFPDGRKPSQLAAHARISPSGAWWTFDGLNFVRLDSEGVVVERAGQLPLANQLHNPGACAVLDGRVCVQDESTGAIFVWNEGGLLTTVGAAAPEDRDFVTTIGRFAASPDGSIWIESKRGDYLGWDADGVRLGFRRFEGAPVFARAGGRLWTLGDGFLTARDPAGVALVSVDRQPDRRWIRGPYEAATFDDGTLAVHADSSVLIYSASGAPLRTITVPDPTPEWISERLDARGDWLLLSSWNPDVLLVNHTTGDAFRFTPADDHGRASWAHGLSRDGKQILSVERGEGSFVLHRFALP